MTDFRPVILVPHYNHSSLLGRYLESLLECSVPVLVVDDGSDPGEYEHLQTLSGSVQFELVRLDKNQGKGAAVMHGFQVAADKGYTHAFQVDADGQHDVQDIRPFLQEAEQHPDTIICGAPVFGEDAPWVRRWGRKFTDAVVWLETWKTGIRDSLCGFRVYPLDEISSMLKVDRPGERMDFDAGILVLAVWGGIPLRFLDTRVIYPEDGTSHFRYFADNARMVRMHILLILRMLLRSPKMLWQRITGKDSRKP